MKCAFLFFSLCLMVAHSQAQKLYIQTFGKPSDPAVIFLHGGPGYNAATFEGTTAQQLSTHGLFVIVYDRRGEGRSKDPEASYTFEESVADIESMYKQFGLDRASLIGHSFGGMVGIAFTNRYPGRVQSLVLVGAPVDLQASFRHILSQSRKKYEEKKDSARLKQISMIENMDPASLMYSSACLQLAMQNGAYTVKNRSKDAVSISARFNEDSALSTLARQMTIPPVTGFWKNEQYTTLDMSATLDMLRTSNIRVYGLYGKEDGLYSEAQILNLKKSIGENQVYYLDDCSHNVYMDQQEIFIRLVAEWCK